jgi:hypothetical protein
MVADPFSHPMKKNVVYFIIHVTPIFGCMIQLTMTSQKERGEVHMGSIRVFAIASIMFEFSWSRQRSLSRILSVSNL